ncbi:hypothetical protein BDN72DRAFT_962296, partial [Pluteus cervinus]
MPRFPPELELRIFTYALRIKPQHPINLLLVAKRVREWLLPIVWEVVIHHNPHLYEIPLDSVLPLQEYGALIRHLLLLVDYKYIEPEDQDEVRIDPYQLFDESLTRCPNITNLALWWLEPPIGLEPLVNLSKLTHLSMDVNRILELIRGERDIDSSGQMESMTWDSTLRAGDARPPLFPKITHLDTMNAEWLGSRCRDNIPTLVHHFPGLTHLAHARTQWTTTNPLLIRLSLQWFERLKVLVWWKQATSSELSEDLTVTPPVEDDRLVLVFTSRRRDWEREARGEGIGMWSFADSVVGAREKARATTS